MFSTVVGSFPVELETSPSFKDKFLNIFGLYDPYKSAIKKAVFHQLESGVDIISDGQVRGDMVGSFSKYIPGMQFEHNSTIITSKIRAPVKEITVDDLKYAKSILKDYYSGSIPENKGVKGIITGPSTIVHSSRIESFYKNKNDAMSSLQVMYDNPQGFTHLFEGDTVEFLEETFYGIKIRKTSGMRELAIIPSMRILKKVNK